MCECSDMGSLAETFGNKVEKFVEFGAQCSLVHNLTFWLGLPKVQSTNTIS